MEWMRSNEFTHSLRIMLDPSQNEWAILNALCPISKSIYLFYTSITMVSIVNASFPYMCFTARTDLMKNCSFLSVFLPLFPKKRKSQKLGEAFSEWVTYHTTKTRRKEHPPNRATAISEQWTKRSDKYDSMNQNISWMCAIFAERNEQISHKRCDIVGYAMPWLCEP